MFVHCLFSLGTRSHLLLVLLTFFGLATAESLAQEQSSSGDCSQNLNDIGGDVSINCNFEKLPGISFETFLRQVLVSEFLGSRRVNSNWVLFAQNTGSRAYLRALNAQGVLDGVQWTEPLFLGGTQIRSASGLRDIEWYFRLSGVRGWFHTAEFVPQELSNGIISEDIFEALTSEFSSVGARLEPIGCTDDGETMWFYFLEVPTYKAAVFVHPESSMLHAAQMT